MSVSVLIAADFCPKNRVANLIEESNYEAVFGEVKPIIEECDFSIVNLECPVRISNGDGIKKNGPALKCSAKAVEALKYAGFSCVTLANNHFYDQGEAGVKDTIATLEKADIAYVGGGYNLQDASKILYRKVKNKTIAIINCCEQEWSIATGKTGGSNPLNSVRQFYDIAEARKRADYVIVIVHGGIEGFQYPSPRMVETYRFFIDAGADTVINHHQHCFSGGELYNGKPIFYGLGNFCFDWQERRNGSSLWDEGYMVQLELTEDGITYNLFPYLQNTDSPGIHIMNENDAEAWQERYDEISKAIQDDSLLYHIYETQLSKSDKLYSLNIQPYNNRIAMSLYMRRVLPSLMSKDKIRVLLNMLRCESHYDCMIHMLKNELQK